MALSQPLTHLGGVECREIPGHEGYLAGADGVIWSYWTRRGGGDGRQVHYVIGLKAKALKPLRRREDGRGRLTLRKTEGGYRRAYIAHFILEAFVGPRPQGLECCHGDGNCLNDAADNLRWDTRQANNLDRVKHGANPVGERSSTCVLREADIPVIRARRAAGEELKPLARHYRVTEANICAICKRRTWKHV